MPFNLPVVVRPPKCMPISLVIPHVLCMEAMVPLYVALTDLRKPEYLACSGVGSGHLNS